MVYIYCKWVKPEVKAKIHVIFFLGKIATGEVTWITFNFFFFFFLI